MKRKTRTRRHRGAGAGLWTVAHLIREGLKKGQYLSKGVNLLRETFPTLLKQPLKFLTKKNGLLTKAGYGRRRMTGSGHDCTTQISAIRF